MEQRNHMKLRENKLLFVFIVLCINTCFSVNLSFAQCSFSGTQTVYHADVIACLSGCTLCTVDIEDGAVITIPDGDQWDLEADPAKDVQITIKGVTGVSSGRLIFDASGGNSAEIFMTLGSVFLIENKDENFTPEQLTPKNEGNIKITIGGVGYKGVNFDDLIVNGGVDENGPFVPPTPLPVDLLYFNAKATQSAVNLSWSTASELNNDFFTLEKSNNGKDFVKLGELAGNGTTNLQMDYSFADKSPYLGLSYYRLSQTDYDGTTEIFPVVSVLFEGNGSFMVGPNPFNGNAINVKISARENREELELNIIDLQGRLVERKQLITDGFGNLDAEIQLKMPMQKGVYIFELSSVNSKERIKVAAH